FHLICRMTPYPHPQNLQPTKLTVSCGWVFHWVNKPEAKELFDFLNSYLKLPDRRALSEQILETTVSEGDKAMHEALREDPIGITLTFDGWTNVKNEQLLGIMIITSEGKPYVWKATDISIERESHLEVMEKTKVMIDELENMKVKVSVVVTDSASPYAASREVFKEMTDLKTTMDRGIRLASYFKNANNKYFIAKLHDQQKITYNKYYGIAAPGETRWNSYYTVVTSLLQTQQALQVYI
ncbi:7473_t:CDS:2, partial [Ambispora gerdemannii]